MSVVVTDYAIPAFRRVLSAEERMILVTMYEMFSAERARRDLAALYADLDAFFASHPGAPFFLRLSTLSPKDAYLDEDDSIPDALRRLRVSDAHSCIDLLCHSHRARIDLDFETAEEAIELLHWLDLDHATETRFFVRGGRVVAATQYYEDLPYQPDLAFVREAIALIEAHPILAKRPDVAADVGKTIDGRTVLIEFNTLDENLDTCCFESLDDLEPVLRWSDQSLPLPSLSRE